MSEKKPSRKSILSSIGSKKQHQKQEAAAAAQAAQAAQSAGPTAAQKNESLNNSNGDHGASNGASDAARYRDDVLKGDNNKAAQDDEHDPDVPDDADANAALQEAEEDYGAPLGPSKDAAALIEEEERANAAAKKSSTPAHKRGSKRADKVDLLTPVQRHYLLKALVSTEMQLEWSELEKLGALTQYGYPFSPTRPKLKRVQKDLDMDSEFAKGEFAAAADDPYADEDQARRAENIAEPLMLRHMFQVFLKPFPGLKEAPLKYWQKRIQPYFDETAARNFSHSTERAELTSRRFYTLAFTRYLGGFMARGFGVRGEGETKGPGKGESGSERWGVGKQWGKGTVKRGLDKPIRIDDALMDKIDSLFSGPEGDVWRRARKETHRVRRDWQAFKEHTIESEAGLEETMAYLQVSNIRNLPPRYRNAEEWARMHAAYLFHNLFVTSPAADSIFGVVKGIHALFPYWGARQLLKVANAESMISGILGLLLARPAGAKSLVQRVFTYVLGKEATAFQKDYIVPFRKEINDIELTKKIEEYVKRASRPEGRAIRSRAERTGADVLTTILLHSSGTQLSSQKQSYVQQLEKSYAKSPYAADVNLAYPPKTPAGKALEGRAAGNWGVSSQEADEARTFALLKLHLRVCLKKRDREQAILFASGSLIPTIIKDSLQQVFFPAIRSIASAVDLSERLHDLQNFIDDLIKIKKKGDDQLVAFIALAARHEQSLYLLFSQMHTIIDPFAAWLQTGADYMAMSTTDPLNPANRKAKNLEVNLEELLRDDRLTQEDAANIVKEVDELAQFVKWQKVWYELEMRKNFILARPEAAPASGLNADDIPKGSMRQEIEDVDALLKELMKAEGVPIEQGDVRTLARGTEKADFPWAWFDKLDPLGQHIVSSSGEVEPDLSFKPRGTTAPIPEMLTLRKLMPAFQDLLRETLPRWQDGDERGPPRDAGLLAPPRAGTTAGASTPANTAPPSVAGDGKSTTKSKGGFGSMFRKK
ncbi:hypothetical protein IE81DRAFT_327260 [Ceraceosorus guamensis]|uniref:DUF3818 domain-containing protein n=1 Tax=Ceraceosorus guamensis TaxID=1522189 RepID=A0A316VNM3_9BASI|nr:hypothetical protein IE81DRAFT_327260 [Ceraceosorus guamensis]PWN38668.1 hypothetical protein IE81DRAFT_327260 [Ceraceosorus guamensis]